MAPIIQLGAPIMGYSPNRGFALPQPRDYRGRVGQVIPGSGIILPAAKNAPMMPVTYALSGLSSGLTFDTATRAIEGSPISVHATNEITYTATDASTPAEVLTRTFQFPIVGSTATTELVDFDNAGLRIEHETGCHAGAPAERRERRAE